MQIPVFKARMKKPTSTPETCPLQAANHQKLMHTPVSNAKVRKPKLKPQNLPPAEAANHQKLMQTPVSNAKVRKPKLKPQNLPPAQAAKPRVQGLGVDRVWDLWCKGLRVRTCFGYGLLDADLTPCTGSKPPKTDAETPGGRFKLV